ncbi:MAG TPA: polymer-forming cytoskeletal protein [Gemmatimonadales bacterium]|jgi:cytoskeletal protein CcmA (bactofilin family)|nr:polymer-forming cytoskeletal protein [Gemmatimonadales bacterium]
MTIWKEQIPPKKEAAPLSPEPAQKKDPEPRTDFAPTYDLPRRPSDRDAKESLIAAEITIEGKIEGTGHIRIAGKFKGDVHVQGNLSIEAGAKLTGGVRASVVVIGGELDGNIDAASRVELLETGILNGNLKAGSLVVAAGSRMRGQVEFGWEGRETPRPGTATPRLEAVAAP